jgi:hypothetical protein
MIARYLSGVAGSSLLRRSSRLMTWSAAPGQPDAFAGVNAMSRLPDC